MVDCESKKLFSCSYISNKDCTFKVTNHLINNFHFQKRSVIGENEYFRAALELEKNMSRTKKCIQIYVVENSY